MRCEDFIAVTLGVRNGKPCIKGTRITVTDVLEYLAGGMTEDEILRDFPDLKKEHIRAALAVAAARERLQIPYTADSPSISSMRSSWLYFATRSLRHGAPVLI